jgi:hypothetical protein
MQRRPIGIADHFRTKRHAYQASTMPELLDPQAQPSMQRDATLKKFDQGATTLDL